MKLAESKDSPLSTLPEYPIHAVVKYWFFEDNSILNIPKLGVTTAIKLQELGISTVGQLKDLAAIISAATFIIYGSSSYTTIVQRHVMQL